MTKVLIIAEAGVNHNGDLEKAKRLIELAADAGADVVKFQTFKAEKLVNSSAKKAVYQQNNTNDSDDSQLAMLQKLELPYEWHHELLTYAKSKNIQFASTGFDEDSVDFLESIGQPFFKIPSGEITNKPYLQHIARKGKLVILSTGMADLKEIKAALNVLLEEGLAKEKINIPEKMICLWNEIIEENNYYPFGLKHQGYNAVVSSGGNSTAQKYKFSGKELQDELGQNVYLSEIRSIIQNQNGVLTVASINVYNEVGGQYSSAETSMEYSNPETKLIGPVDDTIFAQPSQVYQIRYPSKDIRISVKNFQSITFS